ncbi:MAG TPA: hypothetical protein VFY14_03845 [Streptomyces sp.]|nr:hypothetical protein [Streptomyces sp.]
MSHRATRRGFLGLAGKAAAVAAGVAALPALGTATASASRSTSPAAPRPGDSANAACTEPANAGVQCGLRKVTV